MADHAVSTPNHAVGLSMLYLLLALQQPLLFRILLVMRSLDHGIPTPGNAVSLTIVFLSTPGHEVCPVVGKVTVVPLESYLTSYFL
jgi:hypothetical protein